MSKHMKKSDKFIFAFRIISIIIIIMCILKIIDWFLENKRNNDMINNLISNSSMREIEVEDRQIHVLETNLDDLISQNEDTVGWITVPNTRINYPVVHYKNNDFYLNHSFDKTYNAAGWIFANYMNKFDGTDKNISIFGHNRRDGSMFCTLKDTIKPDWYNNEENYYITFAKKDKIEIYKVFSNYQIVSESYYLANEFRNLEEYKDFLENIKSRSVHDYDTIVTENDQILTLSTCANDNTYRVVLHAVKINNSLE